MSSRSIGRDREPGPPGVQDGTYGAWYRASFAAREDIRASYGDSVISWNLSEILTR
jgi:hypothetical protein